MSAILYERLFLGFKMQDARINDRNYFDLYYLIFNNWKI